MNPKVLICVALVLSGGCFGLYCHAAIIFPKAPEEGRQIAYENVSELCTDPNVFHGLQVKDMTITNCHAMYNVATTSIVSGKMLSTAKLAGWTYLFIHATTVVAEVNLGVNPTNGNIIKSSGVGMGDNRLMEGLRVAEQLPQVKKQDYEFRVLQCYPIQFLAVWLHGKSDDIIIPLPTYEACNYAYQSYSESQIIKILKPDAKQDIQGRKNKEAITKAITDYEKAHGGECGSIVFLGMGDPYPVQKIAPNIMIPWFDAMSSKCGYVRYKARTTYGDNWQVVKRVEILEKLTHAP